MGKNKRRNKRSDHELNLMYGGTVKLMKIVLAIIAAVKAAGGTVRDFDELDTPEGALIIKQIADLIVSIGRKVAFTQLLAACKQDWVNPDINEVHFPLVDDGTTGPVEEYCFHREMDGPEAESELKKLGFKFVGMKRAMEYVATHPDNQLDHPIVVIGAQWQRPVSRVYVPYFYGDDRKRHLNLDWLGHGFDGLCRFLVSRE